MVVSAKGHFCNSGFFEKNYRARTSTHAFEKRWTMTSLALEAEAERGTCFRASRGRC